MWRIVQKNYPSSNQYESLYLAIVRKYFPFQKVESEMNIFHQNYRRFHPVSHGASAAPETGAREECLDQPMPTQPSPQGGTVKSWIHPDVGFSSGCDDNYVAIPGASATGGMSLKPISTAIKALIFRQWGWFRGQVCIKHPTKEKKYMAIHNPAGGVGEHLELWVKLLKLATMLW